jgi:nitroimidazol reductase NimA-like FMN-containing flavoprotein (pyridoxamine 5'-phosphate oxidase superfamily)
MTEPTPSRPHFPQGYVEHPKAFVPWSHVETSLSDAVNYWLCTASKDGQPHSIPKWGVWVNRRLYFDGSPKTRHARNISINPSVTVHLESGDDVVILQGRAAMLTKPSPALAVLVSESYRAKYAARGYSPEPSQWDDGGLFEVIPHKVLAWTNFVDDPTKFTLLNE